MKINKWKLANLIHLYSINTVNIISFKFQTYIGYTMY